MMKNTKIDWDTISEWVSVFGIATSLVVIAYGIACL